MFVTQTRVLRSASDECTSKFVEPHTKPNVRIALSLSISLRVQTSTSPITCTDKTNRRVVHRIESHASPLCWVKTGSRVRVIFLGQARSVRENFDPPPKMSHLFHDYFFFRFIFLADRLMFLAVKNYFLARIRQLADNSHAWIQYNTIDFIHP